MKKQFTLLGMIVLVAMITAFGTFAVSKTSGWGYFDALVIGTNPAAPTASLTSAGALTVTSLTNTGAVGGSAITATTSVTSPLFVATGPVRLYSRTQAQIEAIDPVAAGEVYFCSDCTLTKVCVSTSATTMSWLSVGAIATACD